MTEINFFMEVFVYLYPLKFLPMLEIFIPNSKNGVMMHKVV